MSGNGRKDKGRINNSFSGSARHRGGASPNSTDEPRYRTSLIPIDMPIVTGLAGSNNQSAISQQTDMADPLTNLDEILRRRARETGHMPQTDYRPQLPQTDYRPQLPQTDYRPQLPHTDYRSQSPQMFLRTGGNDGFGDDCFEGVDAEPTFRSPHTPHTPRAPNTPSTPHGSASTGISGGHGSNVSDFHASSLPLISRDGERFGDQKIHSACIRLFWENLDRPWAQFSDIPHEALTRMFLRFGTKYRWHSQENENIFDAFKCVLKDRYRDRMKGIRTQSANMARKDGKPLPRKFCSYYDGMHNYRPERVPETVWRRLCDHWSTDKWKKNSKIAQQNRNTADSNGSTARHTAGSIEFDQHRRILMMGKPPKHYDVFMKTHGTAESKRKYFEGNHENLEYCSQTTKEAQEAYLQGLVNKYGEDPANHKDDVDVWEESQLRRKGKKKGATYGIGTSDIHYLVSGTPSSQSTQATQSYSTQQEVDRLRVQVSIMDQQQQQMKEQMEMVIKMINMSGNQPRGPPDDPPDDN